MEASLSIEALERAVAKRPSDLDLRIELGLALVAAGRLSAGKAVFKSVLRQEPGRFGALLGLSKAARAAGDFEISLTLAREAGEADPSEIGVRLDAAFDLIRLKRLDEGEAALERLVEIMEEPSGALIGLGHIARKRGDGKTALSRFLAAAERAPLRIEAWLEAAGAHLDLGEPERALERLDEALRLEDSNEQALTMKGRIIRSQDGHGAALPWFERAAAAHPQSLGALVALAETRHGLGETARADQLLGAVLSADPDHLEALLLQGEFAWQAQDYDRCLALSLKAARAHPHHAAPPLQATRALMEQGRVDEALDLIEPLMGHVDRAHEVRARKAEILMAAGRWVEAEAALGPAAEETLFVAWVQRARLLLTLGRLNEAEAWLGRFSGGGRFEKGFQAILKGQIAEARWDHKAARAAYEAALAHDPNSANAHAELNRVCLLDVDLEACRHHGAEALRLHAGVLKRRGQSTNPTSTHIGQIWDEFRMDGERAERLRVLTDAPPGARIAPLMAMVREAPDHMPTAMMVMIALRQGGFFHRARNPVRNESVTPVQAIPKQIIQYWDEAEPPGDIGSMMEGWRSHNPDFEHLRFDLNRGGVFIRDRYPTEAVRAYARAPSPAQKADVFRLSYLGAEGGVYVDADDRALHPISPLLPPGAKMVAWLEPFGALGNNFLAAAPGDPVILRAQRLAVEAMDRRDEDIPWLSTGPGLLTRAFVQILSEADDFEAALAGYAVLDRHETAPYALFHQFAAYKRTGKHWLRSAFGAREPAKGEEPAP